MIEADSHSGQEAPKRTTDMRTLSEMQQRYFAGEIDIDTLLAFEKKWERQQQRQKTRIRRVSPQKLAIRN